MAAVCLGRPCYHGAPGISDRSVFREMDCFFVYISSVGVIRIRFDVLPEKMAPSRDDQSVPNVFWDYQLRIVSITQDSLWGRAVATP